MKSAAPLVLLLCSTLSGCAFHSTATSWNGRVGPNGEPVHLKSTTTVGLNFLIAIKLFGGTDTGGMVDELTAGIAAEGGDRVRLVQSTSENYWYGFPPLTWIFTPVITTVSADYEPDPDALTAARAEQDAEH